LHQLFNQNAPVDTPCCCLFRSFSIVDTRDAHLSVVSRLGSSYRGGQLPVSKCGSECERSNAASKRRKTISDALANERTRKNTLYSRVAARNSDPRTIAGMSQGIFLTFAEERISKREVLGGEFEESIFRRSRRRELLFSSAPWLLRSLPLSSPRPFALAVSLCTVPSFLLSFSLSAREETTSSIKLDVEKSKSSGRAAAPLGANKAEKKERPSAFLLWPRVSPLFPLRPLPSLSLPLKENDRLTLFPLFPVPRNPTINP